MIEAYGVGYVIRIRGWVKGISGQIGSMDRWVTVQQGLRGTSTSDQSGSFPFDVLSIGTMVYCSSTMGIMGLLAGVYTLGG